ncbi:MAG: FtsQ-type POTRA domain-containing protein [Nitrospirae bacterium]|nr:FtsQ-type POTRA domain-containing protein [Nitrospirota bacterium]
MKILERSRAHPTAPRGAGRDLPPRRPFREWDESQIYRRSPRPLPRRTSWRPLLWLTLGLGALFTLGLLLLAGREAHRWLSAQPALEVQAVEVRGVADIPGGEMAQMLQEIKGRNFLALDLRAARDRLLSHPWIEEATIRREWTGRVQVAIRERTPAAYLLLPEGLYLVDTAGALMERVQEADRSEFRLARIVGVEAKGNRLGEPIRSPRLEAALELAAALRQMELAAGSEIRAHDPRHLAYRRNGVEVRLGRGEYTEQFQRLAEIEETLKARGLRAASIDLRFRDQVVVKPRS